jgi:hypothetical protein
MLAWQCSRCQWSGFSPDFTDDSALRPDGEGYLTMDRRHIPLCPRCFGEVQTVTEAQARELRQVLIGIARSAQ